MLLVSQYRKLPAEDKLQLFEVAANRAFKSMLSAALLEVELELIKFQFDTEDMTGSVKLHTYLQAQRQLLIEQLALCARVVKEQQPV